MSAFDWKSKPSVIGAELDKRHAHRLQCTENVNLAAAQGKNLGTIHGLSKKRHGGAYSRSIPSTKEQS